MKWFDFIISHVKEVQDVLVQPHQLRLIDAHTVRETVCSSDPGPDRDAECAVCLCRIEAGDEIRRLRCSHVFHAACFDRWVGCVGWTCPLCRNHLANMAIYREAAMLAGKSCCPVSHTLVRREIRIIGGCVEHLRDFRAI
ncbi:hypothetical protein SASPL_144220 [Salvia splendens]|uniref:RING-type domain-containing protein n=1 Tax=Salvia splendens TaxID=180675 RepID=A0A8X8WNL3_SALSN|nr:hypothetical protein SASPL_144220 [Salvia splendens]